MAQKFSDFSQEFWQKALRNHVIVDGEYDEALYQRAVRLYTAEDGVLKDFFPEKPPEGEHIEIPTLTVYREENLPEGIRPVDGNDNFHISMVGSDTEIKKRLWDAYNTPYARDDTIKRNTEGVRTSLGEGERIDQTRGEDGNWGFSVRKKYQIKRKRGLEEALKPPPEMTDEEKAHLPEEIRNTRCFRITGRLQNIWGQLLYARELKESDPYDWKEKLEHHFYDAVMQQFSGTGTLIKIDENGIEKEPETDFPLWKYWLRGLRVLNGLSTPKMSEDLEMFGNSYSNIETTKDHHLGLEKAQQILEKNLFGLPIDETGKVQSVYAQKFLLFVDNKNYLFPQEKLKNLEEVKAIAEAYLRGEITVHTMPTLNDLMVRLSDNRLGQMIGDTHVASRIKSGEYIPHHFLGATNALYQLDGEDYSQYFAVMPHYSKPQNKNIASKALNPEQAFELAANTSKGLGGFLEIYRESIGKTLEDVKKDTGKSRGRIRQLELDIKRDGTPSNKSYAFVAEILADTNPYGLPVDEAGKIRADVTAFIRQIHIPPRGTRGEKSDRELQMIAQAEYDKGKWIRFDEVAGEMFGIDRFLVPEESHFATSIKPNPELGSLRVVWEQAIKARAEVSRINEGVINIGNTEVRYKREKGGEYLLHADGLLAIRAALINTISPSK